MSPQPGEANFLLRFSNVEKRFGSQLALHAVSSSVSAGEIVLLLGANGAGKSTFLKLGAGLLRADAGKIETPIARPGYVGHEPMVYAELTVEENMQFFSALCSALVKPETLITAWNLGSQRKKRVSELSRGQQLRVSLMRAMLADPALLLLDEPTSALDEEGVEFLSGTVRACANISGRAGAVVIATHDLQRLRPIATRVILLSKGKIEQDSKALQTSEMSAASARDTVIETYRERNR